MISHIPAGLGNPYRIEPDQRFPYLVPVSHDFEVNFTTDAVCTSGWVEYEVAGQIARFDAVLMPAIPRDNSEYGKPAPKPQANTHLAEAAARAGEQVGRTSWSATLSAPEVPESRRYRCLAMTAEGSAFTSEWFEPLFVEWVQQPDAVDTAAQVAQSATALRDQHGQLHAVAIELAVEPTTAFAGLGERYHAIDHRGRNLDARVYEHYKGQGERAYYPVPFVHLIGEQRALWVRTDAASRFHFGTSAPNRLRIEVDLAEGQQRVEIIQYEGPPAECLRQFIAETGQPTAPPDWVFRLWLSSNEWNTQARVESEVATSRQLGIDAGVVVIEAWSDESTFAVWRDAEFTPKDPSVRFEVSDFTYPADGAWPDPQKMIADLHAQDVKLVLWQIPVLKDRGNPASQAELDWDYASANHMVVKQADGSDYHNRGFWFQGGLLPDFTSAAVRHWWTERRRYLVDMGVDGFKTDGGEHAWGNDLRYSDGSTGVTGNNRFAVLYPQAYHELQRRVGVDPVTFSRAGFTGSSAFPCFWAGDEDSTWEAYRASVIAGINAGASGIYFWGWDIAGFSGALPDAELYLRSVAMATFCPIMQLHSEFNHHQTPHVDRTPWNVAERTGDPAVVEVFRDFNNLRLRLQPFLVDSGKRALEKGVPIMRGLYFDYPEDKRCFEYPLQYLLGDGLLVAPVTEAGAVSLDVYLPAGTWLDAWTGDTHVGQSVIAVDAPLARIPVFVKSDRAHLREIFA